MIKDYKYCSELNDSQPHRSHPRLVGLALIGLALGASALYAALNSETTDTAGLATIATPKLEQQTAEPTTHQATLRLPGQDERATQPEPSKPAPVVALAPPAIEMEQAERVEASDPAPLEREEITVKAEPDEKSAPELTGHWIEEQVRKGDSLARIFKRLNLSPSLLHRIVNSSSEAKKLANIRPGQRLRVRMDSESNFLELVLIYDQVKSLQIKAEGESFTAHQIEKSVERRIATASGTITDSLFLAAQKAGLSDSLTMELANIFGWDIDFALEIRAGDQFSLIYEELYLDGEKYQNGNILAAQFINRGKSFRAVRFEDEHQRGNYFTPDGKSMRKAFLRSPVDFRRISSRFSKSRKHPILGKRRAHRGVDYAAATGTPIKAAGDGRVIFRGTKGGYGRTVIIQHGSQYSTLYAHMSKYRRSVKNGSRVSQGQVIGYVGMSGTATGPHLHYEFRVNGVHRNPLTVKIPSAEPLAKKYRSAFQQQSQPLLSQLDQIAPILVAEAQ